MRRLILGLLMCLPASAAGTTAVLLPYGAWFVCSSPARYLMIDQSPCESLVGGTEQYLIDFRTELSSTYMYEYTIVATVEGIDGPVTVTGILRRKDNAAGWSYQTVQFGGVVSKYSVSLKNLGVIGETVDIQRSLK